MHIQRKYPNYGTNGKDTEQFYHFSVNSKKSAAA